jgi:hypothetical protein
MFQRVTGISRLQTDILQILATEGRSVPPSAILARLTEQPPTPSQRVILSKALKRLCDRGMVEARYPEIRRPGNGLLYRLAREG